MFQGTNITLSSRCLIANNSDRKKNLGKCFRRLRGTCCKEWGIKKDTSTGLEPMNFWLVAQVVNHCATAYLWNVLAII